MSKVRYLTISRVSFELVKELSERENAQFNRIIFSCFQQLENGQEPTYQETESPILNIALREAVSELETGYQNYSQKVNARKGKGEKPTNNQRSTADQPPINRRSTADQPPIDRRPTIEEKRIEEKRKEEKKERFIPPTIEQVREYCLERKNNVDPERWHSYYTANGWKVGKNPMKDWKAAVRTWENGQGSTNSGGQQNESGRVKSAYSWLDEREEKESKRSSKYDFLRSTGVCV